MSIILPAYNEELGVVETIKDIPLKKIKEHFIVEIIVIDNNSSDQTAKAARKLGALVIKEKQQGYGYAYKAGFKKSRGDFLICMDSDGTYPGKDIIKISKLLDKDYDLVIANRFSSNYKMQMPFINKVGNIMLSAITRMLFNTTLIDSQSGMWGIKRTALDKLQMYSNTMAMCQELKIDAIYYEKLKWIEIPISYAKRVGDSKLNPIKNGTDNLLQLIKKRIKR